MIKSIKYKRASKYGEHHQDNKRMLANLSFTKTSFSGLHNERHISK